MCVLYTLFVKNSLSLNGKKIKSKLPAGKTKTTCRKDKMQEIKIAILQDEQQTLAKKTAN